MTILEEVQYSIANNIYTTITSSSAIMRQPIAGVYYEASSTTRPRILKNLDFGTKFNLEANEIKTLKLNSINFSTKKYSRCKGHKFCLDCKSEYSNNHQYCSRLVVDEDGSRKVCGQKLTSKKCDAKIDWFKDSTSKHHIVLFRGNHNHGELITQAPTDAMANAVEKMVKENPTPEQQMSKEENL